MKSERFDAFTFPSEPTYPRLVYTHMAQPDSQSVWLATGRQDGMCVHSHHNSSFRVGEKSNCDFESKQWMPFIGTVKLTSGVQN